MHRHSACVNCRGSTSLAYTKAQPDVFKHEHDKWHCWAKGDSHGHLLYFIDKCYIACGENLVRYLSNRVGLCQLLGMHLFSIYILRHNLMFLSMSMRQ